MRSTTQGSLFFRAHARWAALFAALALVLRAAQPSPPPRTTEGVAAMLGSAVGGSVRQDDFVWEARGGFWHDAFVGRQVLFLARPPNTAQADLYRARVRLTRAGRPVSLSLVRNLTHSDQGDDHDLVAQGHHAAYLISAFGAVQGTTLLDLEGEGDARQARTATERAASALENWLTTGNHRGIRRTEISFATPPHDARVELQDDLLVLALGNEATPAALDVHDGALNTGADNRYAASAQPRIQHAPTIGAVLEQAAANLLGESPAHLVHAVTQVVETVRAKFHRAPVLRRTMPAGSPATHDGGFPPAAMTPALAPALAGEGVWTIGGRSSGDPSAAPCFFEAAIRPDARDPEALVRLVAMDTRQVDLTLEAGVEAPPSPTGLHGTGHPPAGVPAERLLAVFAAGPFSQYNGFVTDRKTFVAPTPGLASIAITDDGRTTLGAWPFGAELPADFRSVLQTPDALLGWNATPRWPAKAHDEPTERSALGLLPSGQLVFAWSAYARTDTLTRALSLAGATYAVPLAVGPASAGFAYLQPGTPPRPLSPDMAPPPDAGWAGRAAHGRWYGILRETGTRSRLGSPRLAPDAGRQPSPAWLPSIQTGTVLSLGAEVHLTTFAPERMVFRLRGGTKEPSTKAMAALPATLLEEEQTRVLAAIGTGVGKRRGGRGLFVHGTVGMPLRGAENGVLVLDRGKPQILRASELQLTPEQDGTELPLTADEGTLRAEARDVGAMRARAAACTLADGTFALASTTFDSDEAATAVLLDLGCTRVVALDRGMHLPTFLHRAGTETAPQPRYEATTLRAVEVPLWGRAGPLHAR